MKFMFIIAKDEADAAGWFENVVLPDFWGNVRIKMEHALEVAREYSTRVSPQNKAAIKRAVDNWNAKHPNAPWSDPPFASA